MLAQTIISRVADWIPRSLKIGVRGNHDSPNRVANAIHSLLNHLPAERYPILECGGVLKGFRMRVDWQIHRSFAYGSWEPEVVDAIQRNVTPGMTAMDIGAHGGFYSLLFSKAVGPAGRVFAFEPLPANTRVLEENILLNGIRNIFSRHEAVADFSGELSFQFPHHNRSLVAGPVAAGDSLGTFSVPCISLDDFMREECAAVDFIKMDVEGAETDVLRGARNLLHAFHPGMMIELHDDANHAGAHPAVALLEDAGYRIEWLARYNSGARILARWETSSLAAD